MNDDNGAIQIMLEPGRTYDNIAAIVRTVGQKTKPKRR